MAFNLFFRILQDKDCVASGCCYPKWCIIFNCVTYLIKHQGISNNYVNIHQICFIIIKLLLASRYTATMFRSETDIYNISTIKHIRYHYSSWLWYSNNWWHTLLHHWWYSGKATVYNHYRSCWWRGCCGCVEFEL